MKIEKALPAGTSLRSIALWLSPILLVPLFQYLPVCPIQSDGFAIVFQFFRAAEWPLTPGTNTDRAPGPRISTATPGCSW